MGIVTGQESQIPPRGDSLEQELPGCGLNVLTDINTRPHMLFRNPRTHMGEVPPPRRFAPGGARASGQKPANSLGCCESSGIRL